jgi:hypothetical protein
MTLLLSTLPFACVTAAAGSPDGIRDSAHGGPVSMARATPPIAITRMSRLQQEQVP